MGDNIPGIKVKCIDAPVSDELMLTKSDRGQVSVLEHRVTGVLNLVITEYSARRQNALLNAVNESAAASLTPPRVPMHTRVASAAFGTGHAFPTDTTHSIPGVITGVRCQWFWFERIWHGQSLWPLGAFLEEDSTVLQLLGRLDTVHKPELFASLIQAHPPLLKYLNTRLITAVAVKLCGFHLEIAVLLRGW